MINTLKLGKLEYKHDERDLKFRDYVTVLPTPPVTFGHENLITNYGMLGNDQYGDCVIAGSCHETMLWTLEGSTEALFTDTLAISQYHTICGAGDNGCDVRTVLDYRQKTGLIDSTKNVHKIGAYVALDQTNINEIKEAIYIFNAIGIGINFPASAMDQFNAGQPWTVVKGSKIEGGHYIPILGYDADYLYVITWGQIQKMDYNFFKTYCDEAWAILSTEMLNNSGLTPEGFNNTQLNADLTAITGVSPSPSPTPVPSPTPTPTPVPPIVDIPTALKNLALAYKQTSITKAKPYIKLAQGNLGG